MATVSSPAELSLARRLLLAGTVLLLVFVLVTAFALDGAFEASARAGRRERLSGQIYMLLAAAEFDDQDRPIMPTEFAEPRLVAPRSGLYAYIIDAQGQRLWQSPSAIGRQMPRLPPLQPGAQSQVRLRTAEGDELELAAHGVAWNVAARRILLTLAIAEDTRAQDGELRSYRRVLWSTLAGLALTLLIALYALVRWGLAPLRRMTLALQDIRRGAASGIEGRYPTELASLAGALNQLIGTERLRQERYRNAMADLAHSLKTPLAVMRGATASDSTMLEEQTRRMQQIVDYHLSRASAGTVTATLGEIGLAAAAARVISALEKVYREKDVRITMAIAEGQRIAIGEDDLLELLGNLLDNACKWCRQQVRLSARQEQTHLEILVEDDGPGIPAERAQAVLARGVRVDEITPGQGIGLAIVGELVAAYGGELDVNRSALGGAALRVRFPPAGSTD